MPFGRFFVGWAAFVFTTVALSYGGPILVALLFRPTSDEFIGVTIIVAVIVGAIVGYVAFKKSEGMTIW